MKKKKIQQKTKRIVFFSILALLIASAGIGVNLVKADQDPAGCTDTGGGISLAVFRADGTTNIGVGTVQDNELVKYKATLSENANPDVCAFEGGTWSITTPDGVLHDVTPVGGIPKIGGAGLDFLNSALVSYTVTHANEVSSKINAHTDYGGGISHADANDTTGGPTLATPKQTTVIHTPTVTTNVHNAAHGVITSAPIGTSVHDNAAVTGVSGIPTGTVDFNLYNNTSCEGTPTTQSGVALNGSGIGESNSTNVPNTGMSYKAHYNGQTNLYTPADGACEPLTADKLTPTVATDIHNAAEAVVTSVSAGTTVHDKATVTGSGPVPTGSVTFTFFSGAGANVCDASSVAAGVVALDGSGIAHPSDSKGPLSTGSYAFRASYSGDANYIGGVAGPCEPLTVTIVPPSISTTPNPTSGLVGTVLNDSATLSGGVNPTGNIVFNLYNPADSVCLNPVYTQSVPVSGNGVYNTTPGYTSLVAGTYHWAASYSGDVNNSPIASGCQDEPVTITAKGHLIVDKVTNPSGDTQSFHFNTTGTGYNPFDLTDQAAPNDQQLDAGTYTVAEQLVAGWDLTSVHCVYDGQAVGSPVPNGEQVTVVAGETVTCTFTNTKKGHLIVDKITSPTGNPTSFSINATGTGTITGGGAGTVTDATNKNYEVTPGTYSVSESALAGWNQTGNTCNGVVVAAGETKTCTITNTQAVQWCSHGYWKQSQHFDNWVNYTPNQQFSSVFENAFPGKTLLQVLQQGGGGLNALGRDTVGELLNAGKINAGYTQAQIISMFNAVYPGTNAQYDALHSQFVAPESCPLN